jgi:hypothetical protein
MWTDSFTAGEEFDLSDFLEIDTSTEENTSSHLFTDVSGHLTSIQEDPFEDHDDDDDEWVVVTS